MERDETRVELIRIRTTASLVWRKQSARARVDAIMLRSQIGHADARMFEVYASVDRSEKSNALLWHWISTLDPDRFFLARQCESQGPQFQPWLARTLTSPLARTVAE